MGEFLWYWNGDWVPKSQVKIDVEDRGFNSGEILFDSMRTFNGKIFRLKQHIDRLYRSMKYMRLDCGLSAEEMTDLCEEGVRRNQNNVSEHGEFTVYPLVTRGVVTEKLPPNAGPGHVLRAGGTPTVIVKVRNMDFGRVGTLYDVGAHGVIARTRSYPPDVVDPKVKHHNRLNFTLAKHETADVELDAWPILTDMNGYLTEGVGYNFFLVTNGVLRTSTDTDILQGVSRGMVIDLADQLNIPCVEEDLQPYDLYTADEAFFCSSGPCVLPMTMVDKRPIADGKPGPMTQQLLAAWSEAVGVDIVDQALRFATGE